MRSQHLLGSKLAQMAPECHPHQRQWLHILSENKLSWECHTRRLIIQLGPSNIHLMTYDMIYDRIYDMIYK